MAPGILSQLLGTQKVVAIDIGSHSIKAVEAVTRKEQVEITTFGSVLTPPGALENGVVVDRAGVAGAITDLLHSIGADATVAAATATDPKGIQPGKRFTVRFEPVQAVAIRIIGKPASGDNPAQAFMSCAELAAFGE